MTEEHTCGGSVRKATQCVACLTRPKPDPIPASRWPRTQNVHGGDFPGRLKPYNDLPPKER